MKLAWSFPAESVASIGLTSVAQLALRPTPLLIGGMGGASTSFISSTSLMSKSPEASPEANSGGGVQGYSLQSEVLPEGMVPNDSSSSIDQECLKDAAFKVPSQELMRLSSKKASREGSLPGI